MSTMGSKRAIRVSTLGNFLFVLFFTLPTVFYLQTPSPITIFAPGHDNSPGDIFRRKLHEDTKPPLRTAMT